MKWTKISLIHNIDGCHTMTAFKCYMNCHPFTALSILISDYYIQSYCGTELYHMLYAGYKYALQIDEIDIDDDNLYTFYKMNDDKFENYIPLDYDLAYEIPVLHAAKAGDDKSWDDDYTTKLSILLKYNETIYKAINMNSTIRKCTSLNLDVLNSEEYTKFINKCSGLLYSAKLPNSIINEIFKYVICISITVKGDN